MSHSSYLHNLKKKYIVDVQGCVIKQNRSFELCTSYTLWNYVSTARFGFRLQAKETRKIRKSYLMGPLHALALQAPQKIVLSSSPLPPPQIYLMTKAESSFPNFVVL
jgi:hypothetical protein